jgi:uncharacterized protein YjbI with pentapeptide repeats
VGQRALVKNVRRGLAISLVALTGAAAAMALPLQTGRDGPVSPKADFTAQQITSMLFKTRTGERPNLAGHNLTYLDLSDLDFKGAEMAESDLYGTDLTAANLSGADLRRTRLDRAVLIRANLSGANLADATILRPTIYSDDKTTLTDAPKFAGANLTRIHIQAELSGADFRGADLTSADFSPLEARPGQGTLTTQPSNILRSCDFSGARMQGANLTRAILTFSRFTGADLRGAKFTGADLSKVDFAGSDLSGADVSGADVYGANFAGARGVDELVGFSTTLNADKALR